jgi:hypothetical protein
MTTVHSIPATALLAAVLALPAFAAEDDLKQRIAACTRDNDNAARLACFDRAAASIEPAPKKVTAIVTAIERRPRGELVLTLDNGQVWAQKDAGAHFPVKVGDPVAVLAGTLGSFRLVVANRATAVTRVR